MFIWNWNSYYNLGQIYYKLVVSGIWIHLAQSPSSAPKNKFLPKKTSYTFLEKPFFPFEKYFYFSENVFYRCQKKRLLICVWKLISYTTPTPPPHPTPHPTTTTTPKLKRFILDMFYCFYISKT